MLRISDASHSHTRMLKSNFFKCILKEWRWLKTSVRSLRKYTKCYRTLGKKHNSHTLQSLNLGEKLHWNASQKNLNNRAWINERESPESGIFNVECKYWTLLLWESFVEALNESNFCCFVLFQTIIIIVNRAGSRAMLANFYFNCCDFVELLFETINCWPKTVWNVRQKLCFTDQIKNLKYQFWCFHLGVIVE